MYGALPLICTVSVWSGLVWSGLSCPSACLVQNKRGCMYACMYGVIRSGKERQGRAGQGKARQGKGRGAKKRVYVWCVCVSIEAGLKCGQGCIRTGQGFDRQGRKKRAIEGEPMMQIRNTHTHTGHQPVHVHTCAYGGESGRARRDSQRLRDRGR